MGKSRKVVQSSIEHLLAVGELATPAKGFYVIVPPEYHVLGCLPAEYFIPYLMEYWNCRYYVGLLTAASYYGAAHQAVQVFQMMMAERAKRPIVCAKVKINFIGHRQLAEIPVQTISTAKSMLTVSTPERTAMDLRKLSSVICRLNHIVTVLTEIQETANRRQPGNK